MPKILTTEEIIKRAEEAWNNSGPPSRMILVHKWMISRLREQHEHAKSENALWPSDPNGTRYESDEQATACHKWESLNATIRNDGHLWTRTGITIGQFKLVASDFRKRIIEDEDAELWSLDYERSSDPGSRCLLSPEEALFLYLTWLRTNRTQEDLEIEFGIDQTTISRYLPRVEAKLKRMLPTARYVMEKLGGMDNIDQIKKIFPGFDGTVIVDGTHVEACRPQDKEERKAAYSGKKKTTTYNTGVYATSDGGILGISGTKPGSTHDITELRESIGDMGVIGESMRDPDTPADERLELLGDGGYQGVAKDCPGANVTTPTKKPRNGELTPGQKQRNKSLSSRRIVVEHVMGDIKEYKIMRGPFVGTPEQFNETFNVITGLVNLKKMWPNLPPDLMRAG